MSDSKIKEEPRERKRTLGSFAYLIPMGLIGVKVHEVVGPPSAPVPLTEQSTVNFSSQSPPLAHAPVLRPWLASIVKICDASVPVMAADAGFLALFFAFVGAAPESPKL